MNKLKWILIGFLFLSQVHTAQVQELSLSDAISRSLGNNYGIIIARAEIEIASINNNWGTAGRYPSVSFDAASNNNINLGSNTTTNRLSAGVGMDWTIFDGFRVNITKQRLEELENLAGGYGAVVVENTVEDVILAYYYILLQMESLKVMETVMKLSEDRYSYELARHELGGSVTYNVLQAQNVYLSDKARKMNQEVVLRSAIRDFNFLLAEDPSTNWNFTEAFEPDASEYQVSDLLSKMLSGNQTLRNQYTNLVLQQKNTELKKSDMYPRIRILAGIDESFTRMQTDNNDPVTSSGLSPYGNLSLSYNLYTGGTRKRAMQVARIGEDIAQVEIDEMEHSLTNFMFNVYDFYTVRIALLDVASESLDAAELNLQIADEKFKTGAINSFNYRDIQLIYLNAALGKLRAVYDLIDSGTVLTRITGGFIAADQLPENQ